MGVAFAERSKTEAIEDFPDSFDANIGLTEIYYKKGTFGTAYLQNSCLSYRWGTMPSLVSIPIGTTMF